MIDHMQETKLVILEKLDKSLWLNNHIIMAIKIGIKIILTHANTIYYKSVKQNLNQLNLKI